MDPKIFRKMAAFQKEVKPMKRQKRLITAALSLSMALSLLGGSPVSATASQPATSVVTDSEQAYEPLAQTASIAYERHEDGYEVSLDRAADSVTMNITAVPGDENGRAQENARLYIRTGVALKPGTAYRVSFSLWAEQAQPEYTVCFDGSSEGAVLGSAGQRSIDPGGTDRVQYQLTSSAECGELVLRLLLGKTNAAGNTFRFSDLAVEEVSANEVGENVVLADHLDYNAPGFIRVWTDTGRSATVTCDKESATLTVTNNPVAGAEVWKIQMRVATGIKPEAGKIYHICANVDSTAKQKFELCFNEGETEKGYGVEYDQRLWGKEQKLEYMLYIPKDKKTSGELILQFSLGKLNTGDQVTFSNIFIEEAAAKSSNVLPKSFSFEDSTTLWSLEPSMTEIDATDISRPLSWNAKASASKSGDCAGRLTTSGGEAALTVIGGTNVWDARLNINTGEQLEAGSTYLVSFQIHASAAYSEYEILFGSGFKDNGIDNNAAYGERKGLQLSAKTTQTITFPVTPKDAGGLLISLQLGKTDGRINKVTVSGFQIETLAFQGFTGGNLADVRYPSETAPVVKPTSFRVRAGGTNGGTLTGNGSTSATMTCTGGADSNDIWQRGLFIDNICALAAGASYDVSFDITFSAYPNANCPIVFSKDDHFGAGEGAYGTETIDFDGVSAYRYTKTVQHTISSAAAGKLYILVGDLGNAPEDTQITISNIRVVKTSGSSDIAAVTYPSTTAASSNTGSFRVREEPDAGYSGTISGDGNSAMLTSTGTGSTDVWRRGIFVDDICTLTVGVAYKIRFDIQATASTDFEVTYNKDDQFGDGQEKAFGGEYSLNVGTTKQTIEHTVTPTAGGKLYMCICLGKAAPGTAITVSNIQVLEDSAAVTYPATTSSNTGSFRVREESDQGYTGTLSGDGSCAMLTSTGTGSTDVWRRGIFVDDICTLTAGVAYKIRFDIQATASTDFEVAYSKDDQFGAGEKAFGGEYGLNTGTTNRTIEHTVTPDAGGKLYMCICLGKAVPGTAITVSNIQVLEDSAAVTYPASSTPTLLPGSFRVRTDNGTSADLTGDGSSATITCTGSATDESGAWARGLFIDNICSLAAGTDYKVTFDITFSGTPDMACPVVYSKDDHFGAGEGAYGTEAIDFDGVSSYPYTKTVEHTISSTEAGGLYILIGDLGKAAPNTAITVSNIHVLENDSGASGAANLADVAYPSPEKPVSFRVRADGSNGAALTGDGSSYAAMACTGSAADAGGAWARGLFIDNICSLAAGTDYKVTFDITFSGTPGMPCPVVYSKDDHFKGEGKYGRETIDFNGVSAYPYTKTVEHTISSAEAGGLYILIGDLGCAAPGTEIKISNIQVQKTEFEVVSMTAIDSFASVWAENNGAYTAALTKNSDSAVYTVSHAPANTDEAWQGYNVKLFIRTGLIPNSSKYYRVSFNIQAENAQEKFHVLYNGVEDKHYGGEYNISLAANTEKTVSHIISPNASQGELVLQLELGLIDGVDGNTFTVSGLKVEEVNFNVVTSYENELTFEGNSPCLRIIKAPMAGDDKFEGEEWKVKMFIDTGLAPEDKDEMFLVSFDVWAEEEVKNFKVCYNRGEIEELYGSVSGLHVDAGSRTNVEHIISYQGEGNLILQLMFGSVVDPNYIVVDNLEVRTLEYTYSGKNLLANAKYQAPSAVSYWAHEDYTTEFTGTDDAITANITAAPAKGAEPWKIKLFLDTGVTLRPGKYYKVTADVSAQASQDFEVCYNNGGVEMGYDSYGGLRLMGGEPLTVEKTISVPKDKTDASNLMLQFNLGKTTQANKITVSGVKVEEVALSYNNMMPADFAYTAGSTVNIWTNPDYTATLESLGNAAKLHITDVPAADPAVWKAKLLVSTGAVLCAGKTYLVSADLLASKEQTYELCYNNEETEKGFDVLYNQHIEAGTKTTIQKNITVPASMTDAGELILQFSVGDAVANDFTVSGVSVQELNFGAGSSGSLSPDTVINLYDAAGTLGVTREKLSYQTARVDSGNAIKIVGAGLRAGELCSVSFTAKADRDLTGTFALAWAEDNSAVISQQFALTSEEKAYSFTTTAPLSAAGAYDLLWRFAPAGGQESGGANVEISNISVDFPAETLSITHAQQNVMVNGKMVATDTYNINNGNNYLKLRDLAMLLNDTDAQFAVRYNARNGTISLTTGKPYTPVGGELTVGKDLAASCVRNTSDITINGDVVNLKAYTFGGYNFFRLRDLNGLLGFTVDYLPEENAISIQSPLSPEAQEKRHAYDLFFLPEIDGESQPYVGDTMPYYEDGTYYIYYLKDGGDAYNHSIYLATTKDFVTYTEMDQPVLSASREDVQDNWIGTGSLVNAGGTYYFFYTGFNASGSQEYKEKIMVARGSSLTSFEKVSGWEITPPAELGQKSNFRDPQAYYDPETKTISLTITADQDGTARILKYTLGKDLRNVRYDGIIFTDPTGSFWNMECSDTFRLGDKWYLTYSGQDDTLWYAVANTRFGPYSTPTRLEGKLFYAAKHVEDGQNSYMVGWARRANSASSTQEVSGWAGNIAVQKLEQRSDGSLLLVPVDSILSAFDQQEQTALEASEVFLTAGAGNSYKEAFTTCESFMLKGKFTYTGTGSFGLAFDFNGKEEQYKLISIDPQTNKLSLSFGEGKTPITETQAELRPGQDYSFTYIQDGSVGIFYVDGQAALSVRLYGTTGKPIYLFAENNSVTFTCLEQFTR